MTVRERLGLPDRREGRGEAPAPAAPKRKPKPPAPLTDKQATGINYAASPATRAAMGAARGVVAGILAAGKEPCYVDGDTVAVIIPHDEAAALLATGRYTARLTPR